MKEPAHDALLDAYGNDDIDWRGDPPGRREGCYWSFDGKIRVHMGAAAGEAPGLAAQRVAGEEDQAAGAPAWGA